MARSRNLKPAFFDNFRLAQIPPLGRLLFAGLWCQADRAGRLEDEPVRIKAKILPYDRCDIEKLLGLLAQGEDSFIIRYQHGDRQYLQIRNWGKHQNPHVKEPASIIPEPDMNQTGTIQEPNEPSNFRNEPGLNLIPLTLNPQLGNPGPGHAPDPAGFEEWFERQYSRHPKKRDKIPSSRIAVDHFRQGKFTLEQFESRHKAWCESEEWTWKNGAKAPRSLGEWITDEGYLYDPPAADGSSGVADLLGHTNPNLITD